MNANYKESMTKAERAICQEIPNEIELDEEMKKCINADFEKIKYLDQTNVDVIFQTIHYHLVQPYKILLPEIVSFSVYPFFMNFLRNTTNEDIHRIIISFFVVLSGGKSKYLLELMKINVLDMVAEYLHTFQFPKSIDLLVQIVCNFLADNDESLSSFAFQKFSFDFFIELIKFVKNSNLENRSSIVARSLPCFFNFFQGSLTLKQATDFLNEFASLQDSIFEVKNSKIFFSHILLLMCNNQILNYDVFNLHCYPNFIYTQIYDEDEEVRIQAIQVIYRMVEQNRFALNVDFPEIFGLLFNANIQKSQLYASSLIRLCTAFLTNNKYRAYAFDVVITKANELLNIFNDSDFVIKTDIANLFATLIDVMNFSQYKGINNLNLIFMIFDDVLASHDVENAVNPVLHALHNYLFNIIAKAESDEDKLSAIQPLFESNLLNTLALLTESDNEEIKTNAYQITKMYKDIIGVF